MKRIIILSDLWGAAKADWVVHYTSLLNKYFITKFYDCRQLGNISMQEDDKEVVHKSFTNGGIDTAVRNLVELEREAIYGLLGISIGGVIGWKACSAGLPCQHLFVASSTRLRFETQKPSATIDLFYGENDLFKPNDGWFKKLGLMRTLYKNEGHEMYTKHEIAQSICERIIEHSV
ncbi:MAG TPA: hypothetical protein PLM56_16110 [Cyclobacteriaceae bacterium]|jgi:hypothetical protein|nr:alpha/beta hydrolase [Cytophagales bacterium]HMR55681.1 hypothetical protein [Cyclobacteriaceae bacterium]HRE68796.1 hypothetical protein [Cyclobacteriaceae bacterium]HRF35030.1 hypothetical protein [Cyclobacteriaceae bacterium]